MNEFLTTLKDDLLDRRLLPLVALVAAALIAGLVYALAGGGSGSAPPALAPSTASAVPPGLAVTATTNDKAVAETTDGVKEQQGGSSRDPFTQLAGTATTSGSSSGASSARSAASSSSSSSSSSGSGTGSGGSSESSSKESPKEPAKEETKPSTRGKHNTKKTFFHVAILFGPFPPGATPETVTLTPYENLKLQTPLPSAKQPLIVFRGVTAFGKSATFTIVGETILHGQGACLPSPSQCQALDLKSGQTEQLEYLQPNGETSVYELRVVSIEKATASAASLKHGRAWDFSREGAEVLRKNGLETLPYLRYASPGLLVYVPPQNKRARDARAHAAVVRWHFPRFW